MPTPISITLDTDALSPEHLGDVVSRFAGLLREVDRELSPADTASLDWRVTSLKYESPALIELTGHPKPRVADIGPQLAIAVLSGLEMLDQHTVRPDSFNDDALTEARSLAQRIDGGIRGMIVQAPTIQRSVAITRRLVVNVDEVVMQGYSIGTVEGPVHGLNIHGDPYFTVYEDVSGRAVRCFFDLAALLEAVTAGVGKKVSVSGRLRRDVRGRPNQIRPVDKVTILIGRDEEVPAPNLVGSLPDIGDTSEYLERIRGG